MANTKIAASRKIYWIRKTRNGYLPMNYTDLVQTDGKTRCGGAGRLHVIPDETLAGALDRINKRVDHDVKLGADLKVVGNGHDENTIILVLLKDPTVKTKWPLGLPALETDTDYREWLKALVG